jgi:hypothetical protein
MKQLRSLRKSPVTVNQHTTLVTIRIEPIGFLRVRFNVAQ